MKNFRKLCESPGIFLALGLRPSPSRVTPPCGEASSNRARTGLETGAGGAGGGPVNVGGWARGTGGWEMDSSPGGASNAARHLGRGTVIGSGGGAQRTGGTPA